MTKEEFESRFGSIHDFVLGWDCDMQKTLTNTRALFHTAVTQKDFDAIMELFKKYAEEN